MILKVHQTNYLVMNQVMKTKKVTISLTPEQQDKAKKDSIELFGKENLSGYLQVLIQNGLQNRRSDGKK